MKEYEVEVRPGVTATFLFDDETAKRLGYLKDGTAQSDSKASENGDDVEVQGRANKALSEADIKAQNTAKRKAAAEAKKAADAAKKDKG